MARGLTTKGVEAAKPDPVRRIEIPDPALSGLYLVVQPSGTKAWAARYRFAGKPAKLTLGRWPGMGLAEARAAAGDVLDRVARGIDPAADRRETKQRQELADRDKVSSLIAEYGKRHLSAIKSGAHARQFLDRFVIPAWGERQIQEITRRDVIDLIDGIMDSGRGTTANRVLAHTRAFLNWAASRDVIAASPAAGVKPPAREVSRDRVLSDGEVSLFWKACGNIGQPWGPLGRFLLLTAQRLNEAAQITDGEIDGEVWRLPPGRVKNGRAHDVPLAPQALEVLASVKRLSDQQGRPCPFIFTTNGRSAVSGFHKARATIAAEMERVANLDLPDGSPSMVITPWGFHDLRRTAATGMARLGVAVRVTEAVLNHVSGTGAGIVGVYQRHDFADEKRAALNLWARHVASLVGEEPSNVVPLVATAEVG